MANDERYVRSFIGTCIEGLWEGFTKEGWEELDGFICDELEEGAYISLKRPSEATSPYGWAFRKLPDLSKDLGVRVPEGLFVMPSGLTVAVELNGTLGAVTGRYVNGRVGRYVNGRVVPQYRDKEEHHA